MSNSDDNWEEVREEYIKNNRDSLEKQLQELQETIRKDIERDNKYIKRMKIFSVSLLIYIATIVIVAVCMIIFPSFEPIGTIYLFICNILGALLCAWNIFHLFQTGLIKEKIGKWLMALGIFGVLVNLFAIFDDFILARFF
jgi:uncharacterized membrane protein HdeD (DUF308 family)